MPRLPAGRRRKSESNVATALAMLGVLVVGGGLLGLGAMVAPNLVALIGLGLVLVMFIAFHYLVWGRWLIRRLNEESDEPTESHF